MIALDISPGLFRSFRIESLPWYDEELDEVVRSDHEQKIKTHLAHPIYASDLDPEMITLSEQNAHRMNVRDYITFRIGDAHTLIESDRSAHTYIGSVNNPPYGDRMEVSENVSRFMSILLESDDVFGGFISNSEADYQRWGRIAPKNRKLQHGGKLAYFYYRPWQKSNVKKEERK